MIPTAKVIAHGKRYVKIRCPHCQEIHNHITGLGTFEAGTTHRRAPGCGIRLTEQQRLDGYTFTIPGTQGTAA